MTTTPPAETFESSRARALAAKDSGARRHVRISAEHLIAAGASEILALDPAALRGAVALASDPSGRPALRAAVGVVSIEGPLAQRAHFELEGECGAVFVDGYDFITERLRSALADEAIEAIVLRIDSPGGDVAGIEEAITRMQAAVADAGKPVVVYVDELAASAGYWLASCLATDGVFAPAAGRIGCIGVIGALISEARALELIGIDVEVIAEPEGKAEGHPALPISKVAKDRCRARIVSIAGRFFDAVSGARSIESKAVKALDGDIFLAAEAQRRKLIDGVQSFEATVALAAEKGRDARQQKEKSMQTEKDLALVLAAAGAADAASAQAKIEALKIDNEQLRGKVAKVTELEAKLAKLEADKAEGDLVAMVDKAVADGRIMPANREAFLADARTKGGSAFAEAVLKHLQPVAAVTGPAPIPPKADGIVISAELRTALQAQGMTEDEYRKTRADMLAAGHG